jgi:RNA polymerase sigma-70 factor (ECF subfamily)
VAKASDRVPAAGAPAAEPDEGFVARAARGDLEAFLGIYERYAGAVQAIARRWFSRPFEQEEATQEIWLHLHRVLGSFDPARGRLGPWLQAVAANRCREIVRAARRRPPDAAEEDPEAEPTAAEDPEAVMRGRRVAAAVGAFMQALAPPLGQVLQLAFVEERSHEEIAARLSISVRRSKYLKQLVLRRAAGDPGLLEALDELSARKGGS